MSRSKAQQLARMAMVLWWFWSVCKWKARPRALTTPGSDYVGRNPNFTKVLVGHSIFSIYYFDHVISPNIKSLAHGYSLNIYQTINNVYSSDASSADIPFRSTSSTSTSRIQHPVYQHYQAHSIHSSRLPRCLSQPATDFYHALP
jgi:hypothetical protein